MTEHIYAISRSQKSLNKVCIYEKGEKHDRYSKTAGPMAEYSPLLIVQLIEWRFSLVITSAAAKTLQEAPTINRGSSTRRRLPFEEEGLGPMNAKLDQDRLFLANEVINDGALQRLRTSARG